MITEHIKGTRNVRLHEDFLIETRLGSITIKKGFVSDGASVPPLAWFIVAPLDPGIREAALIHDWFYRKPNVRLVKVGTEDVGVQTVTRKIADEIFSEELGDEGIPNWKRYPMFWAVRLIGGGPPKALVPVFSKIPLLRRWKSSWVN